MVNSLPIIGVPGLFGGGIDWLLLDRFLTDLAAGAVDGTDAEPGPGTRTVTDSGNKESLTGEELVITAITGDRDPWHRYVTGISRVAGKMLRVDTSVAGLVSATGFVVGFSNTLTTPSTINNVGFSYAPGSVRDGISNVLIEAFDISVLHTQYVILRTVGYFVLRNDNLLKIDRSEATATLYPHVAGRIADATLAIVVDNLGVVQLPITNATLFPIPTVSDKFTDTVPPLVSDGLAHVEADGNGAGVTWNGPGTFTNNANKAYVDAGAALGAELLTNGDMESGDPPDDWDSQNATLSANGDAHAGSQALEVAATASTGVGRQDITNAAGSFLRFSAWLKNVDATSIGLGYQQNGGSFVTQYGPVVAATSYNAVTMTARAITTASRLIFRTIDIGTSGLADDASAKEMLFKDLLRAVSDTGQPYAAVAMTIEPDTQAGVMINLDSVTNPQNGIRVWYDLIDAKIYAQELIAGVWQADSLAGVSATYGAGDLLEVRRIGNSVYVFYDGAYVGNVTASSSNANTLTALWATDNASFFADFESYPATGYDYARYD